MPRPQFRRKIGSAPDCACFKPAGLPMRELEESVLTVDEYEAVRLADLEGLYQEKVAEQMGVSRQTVGRILQVARRKIADAIVNGKMLRIEGGVVVTEGFRDFICKECGCAWQLPFDGGRPNGCPDCGSDRIRRCDFDDSRGHGHHHGGRGGSHHDHGHGKGGGGHGGGCGHGRGRRCDAAEGAEGTDDVEKGHGRHGHRHHDDDARHDQDHDQHHNQHEKE